MFSLLFEKEKPSETKPLQKEEPVASESSVAIWLYFLDEIGYQYLFEGWIIIFNLTMGNLCTGEKDVVLEGLGEED